MKTVRKIAVIVLGLVFYVAGILKLMDPVGAGLVVGDYLKFFHLGFLGFSSRVVAEALSLAEAIIGAALLTGVWRNVFRWITAAFLAFFTVLTLIILIFNPSMDCGCFGEAVKLTHFQTFAKNLVLCALWALVFLPLKGGEPAVRVKYVSFGIGALGTVLFALYSLLAQPSVEFTPFRCGEEISRPDDEEMDSVDTAYVYSCGGKEALFLEEALPDSSWTFEREELLIGYMAEDSAEGDPVLSLCDALGNYRDSLAIRGNVLAVSVYAPEKMPHSRWNSVSRLCSTAASAGFSVLLLVSGDPDEMPGIVSDDSLLPLMFFADRRTLMTLNRSNGGVTYISDGQIVKKWSVGSYPSSDELEALYDANPSEVVVRTLSAGRMRLHGLLLFTFAVMLIL